MFLPEEGELQAACVSKNEEFCIKNEEFCINDDEFCRSLALMINCITMILGVAVSAFGMYVRMKRNDSDEESFWYVMAGEQAVVLSILLGMVMFVWGIFGIVAMGCARNDKNGLMVVFAFILFCVIIVQTIGAAIFLVWIKDTYSLEAKTYKSLGSDETDDSTTDDSTRLGIAFVDGQLDVQIKPF